MPSAWIGAQCFCCVTLLVAQWSCHAAEKCVPTAAGEWRCGKDVTEADAAPLPQIQERTQPPVMLIDPRRFGEADSYTDASESEVGTPALNQPEVPPVEKTVTQASARTTSAPSTNAVTTASNGNFVVQLAVASSPRGFDALLKQIGAAARTSQRRQLENGNWVLLMGSFSTLDSARLAIPSVVPGAFVRDLASLKFK
jgi:septal ring-binding cell division protein DamX